MRLYDQKIVDLLNDRCMGEIIHRVALGLYIFDLGFGGVETFSNEEKVLFQINESRFMWNKSPIDAPVWLLISQVIDKFELRDPTILRMRLRSGDIVDFYTVEGMYESQVIQFPNEGDAFVMEIF